MMDRPVKVLHVVNWFTDHGGAEVSLIQTLAALSRFGIRSGVVPLYQGEPSERNDELQSAGVIVWPAVQAGGLRAMRHISALARTFEPDLIHSHVWDSDLVARFVALRLGKPHLISLVNTQYDEQAFRHATSPFRLQAYRLAELTLNRATASFHAITDAVAEHGARELGIPREQIVTIPRARDLSQLGHPNAERRSRIRDELGIPDGGLVVLNVGRQDTQKGQALLVDAFSRLAKTQRDLHLVIAGRAGNASQALTTAVSESGACDQIHVLGLRSDVPDLLAAADVFVFSSLWEGLGGAVLEAMAMRRCIVAFDVPAVREVLGGTGLLAAVGDPRSLSERLAVALADPGRRAVLGAAAFERFRRTYTYDAVAPRMAELFQGAAAGGRKTWRVRNCRADNDASKQR
jgi:glycosyltransferase involved in cell wall biosynthesis